MRACLPLVLSLLAACDTTPEPRAPGATGEPAPTASTSAQPLWISNDKHAAPPAK